ncbi:hypothetical protein [Lysobacter gummosus]|uniref:hypothetical protein n=1 Tax=Lysobacter gummosus TaxID=262324 RepID=UPI0036301F95
MTIWKMRRDRRSLTSGRVSCYSDAIPASATATRSPQSAPHPRISQPTPASRRQCGLDPTPCGVIQPM